METSQQQTKPQRVQPSLDRRIALALADESTDRDTFANLWEEAYAESEQLKQLIDQEGKRALDIENEDPEGSCQAVERAKLTIQRLVSGVNRIKTRIEKIDRCDRQAVWDAEFKAICDEREGLIKELLGAEATIRNLADLFCRVEEFDSQRLRQLHFSAPPGELRRLRTVELEAYNLDHFTLESPSITKNLKLPDPAAPNKLLFPREDRFWTASSNAMIAAAQALERKQLGYGPDWFEARKLQDQERRAEIERVETEEKVRREKEQEQYYQTLKRHEEMRRTGVRPNGPQK